MSKDRRSRGSFSDLAKLASTPPTSSGSGSSSLTPTPPPPASLSPGVQRGAEAGSDDSGIVDFKMIASLDPLAEERAKATPLADQGLFDDDKPAAAAVAAPTSDKGASTSAAAPVSAAPPSSKKAVAAAAGATASAAPPATAKKEEKKSGKGGTIAFLFGGVVLVGAVAASAMFYVKNHEYPWTALTRPKAPDVVAPIATVAPTAAPTETVAQNDTTPQQQVDPNLPPDPNPKPGIKKPGPVAIATAKATQDPKLSATVKDLPPSQGGGGGGLSEAMKNVVGPVDTSNTQVAPAAGGGGGGNVPQKPSQGMVQGAVNAVLPGARSCLGPDDPVSKATVVFQSDGSVQSVAVTGSASGKPAEQCIKNALSKAKVQPFAEPTFSFPVTVRPSG